MKLATLANFYKMIDVDLLTVSLGEILICYSKYIDLQSDHSDRQSNNCAKRNSPCKMQPRHLSKTCL